MKQLSSIIILVMMCFLFTISSLAAEDKTFQATIESIDLKLNDNTQLGKDQLPIAGTIVTLSSDSNAKPEKVKISGKITGKDAQPIMGATVKTSLSTLVKTNASGSYVLEEKAGDYDLTAEADGYIKQVKKISSQPNDNLTQNFSLKKKKSKMNSSGNFDLWLILLLACLVFGKKYQKRGGVGIRDKDLLKTGDQS